MRRDTLGIDGQSIWCLELHLKRSYSVLASIPGDASIARSVFTGRGMVEVFVDNLENDIISTPCRLNAIDSIKLSPINCRA